MYTVVLLAGGLFFDAYSPGTFLALWMFHLILND